METQATDRLSLLRTFGTPGYTPARKVRIYQDRWYLATMQNVERDPRCDYIGLAEGEYTELVNGAEAKDCRESRLNHLNHLVEYTGPVYSFQSRNRRPTYHRSEAEAKRQVVALEQERQAWRSACEWERDRHLAMTPEKAEAQARSTGIGSAFLGQADYWIKQVDWHHKIAAECQKSLDRDKATDWPYTITQLRQR